MVLLPGNPAHAAALTLDVTPELTASPNEAVELTATISEQQASPTTVNFEVLPAPAGQPAQPADKDGDTPNTPDDNCIIAAGQTECSVNLISKQASINDVRVWIAGQAGAPDMTEGRLSKKSVLGLNGDCVGGEGGLFGSECETGNEAPGTIAEFDATDVVRVQWLNFTEGRLNCDDAKASDGTDVEYNNGPASDRGETYTCTLSTLGGVADRKSVV